MTKTKQQLRAEAVERLRARKEKGNFIEHIELYAILLDSTPDEVCEIPNREVADGIIDLLTDDCGPCYSCARLAELMAENSALRVKCDKQAEVLDLQQELLDECDVGTTTKSSEKDVNDGETNGIHADAPLVEGDAVAILRKAAKCTSVNTSVGDVLRYNVPGNEPSAWQTEEDACMALANMVERDYVSREAYEDLRDEFVWISTFLHRVGKQCGTKDVPSLKAYVEQLEAKVDELTRENARLSSDEFYLRCTLVDMDGEVVG